MADHGPKHKTRVAKDTKFLHPKGKNKRRGPGSPGLKIPKNRGRKKTGTRNIA